MSRKKIIFFSILLAAASSVTVILITKALPGRNTITDSSNKTYIAMGDSVAAGQGLDGSSATSCGVSTQAYGSSVASTLGLSLTNIACSGATIPAGLTSVQPGDTDTQLNKLFTGPAPGVVSLTIGANDVDWLQMLQACYSRECGTDQDKAMFASSLKTMNSNLRDVFDQIRGHYPDATPRLFVTGYYQLVTATSDASALIRYGVSSSSIAWIVQMQTLLNDSIKDATNGYDFVHYVPIDFTGHEFYSANPWVQNLQASAPLHPNVAGQDAIAKQVVAAIKDN